MSITNIIFDYLQQNRRLTVPAFGTFLSKGEGQPLLFSEFMKEDDGVLRGLMIERGMSELEAAVKIDRFVFDLRHAATLSERSVLPGLGYILCEDGRNLQFEYDPEAVEDVVDVADAEEVAEVAESQSVAAQEEVAREANEPIQERDEASGEESPEVEQEQLGEWQPVPIPAKRGTFKLGLLLAILVLIGAIFAMGYGILVQWRMGNVSFGEEIDDIIFNIFG